MPHREGEEAAEGEGEAALQRGSRRKAERTEAGGEEDQLRASVEEAATLAAPAVTAAAAEITPIRLVRALVILPSA